MLLMNVFRVKHLQLNKKSRKTEKTPSFLQAPVKRYPSFFTSSRGLSKTLYIV
jgi:hypothetical protein